MLPKGRGKVKSPSHDSHSTLCGGLARAVEEEGGTKGIWTERKVRNSLPLPDLVNGKLWGDTQHRHTDTHHTTHSNRTSKPAQPVAGHGVNTQKSAAFAPVSNEQSENEIKAIPFTAASRRIKYLEIDLTKVLRAELSARVSVVFTPPLRPQRPSAAMRSIFKRNQEPAVAPATTATPVGPADNSTESGGTGKTKDMFAKMGEQFFNDMKLIPCECPSRPGAGLGPCGWDG